MPVKKKNGKKWITILVISMLASLPLMMKGIHNGHDMGFHLMRIEGIAEELKRGQFPVRMQSLWLDGYGYPVSIYYGDILLYISALLRLLGVSIVASYKVYIWLINIGTAAISYFCFEKIWKNERIAIVTSLAYMTAGYRLVDIYVRASVGEYSAMMFLPIVALSVYQIYTSEDSDKKSDYKNALLLCLGITGVLGTHILSTEMTVCVLGFVCVILWRKTFRKKTILIYLLSIVETLLLNLYFIVPFLDYVKNVHVNINVLAGGHYIKKIQSAGAYPSQYFSFFQDIFGINSVDVDKRMQISPGLLLMCVLVFGIVYYIRYKRNKQILLYIVLSAAMLFLATNIFPWDFLAESSQLGNMLVQVQYPWRYLSFAILFLVLLLGEILKELFVLYPETVKILVNLTVCICFLMVCYFTSSYSDGAEMVYFDETAELNTKAVGSEEYLLVGTDKNILNDEIQGNLREAAILVRDGTYMELFITMDEEGGNVELPLFGYKGYSVVDESGIEHEFYLGSNNRLSFFLPAGYSGKIYVNFSEPWYWKIAEIISAIWLCCILARIIYLHKVLRREEGE